MTLRKTLAIPIAAGMLLLSACAALGGVAAIGDTIRAVAQVAGRPADASLGQTAAVAPAPSGSPTVGDRIVVHASQGLILAHNAYQTAAAATEVYVRAGGPSRERLLRIRELNNRAIVLLEQGGGGLTIAQRAAEVMNIVAELDLFSGRNR